jgi:hypothetical protein
MVYIPIIMDVAANKHFKFINSKTGNVIFYHSINSDVSADQIKVELEKIKAQVASQNSVFLDTIYWEEFKKEDK